MTNALLNIQNQTFNFKNWIKFIDEMLESQKKKPIEHRVQYLAESFSKNSYDTLNNIREMIDEQMVKSNVSEKESLLSGYFIGIDKIFSSINDHNDNFSLERVSSSFQNLGLKGVEDKFDSLEELSEKIADSYDIHFRRLLSHFIPDANLYFGDKMKKDITNIIKSEKINFDLKKSFGETQLDLGNTNTLLIKENITDTDILALKYKTFKFKNTGLLTVDISALTDLCNSLKKNSFIHEGTTLGDFRSVFSGINEIKYIQQKVMWLGTNAELHYLIDAIFPLMMNPENEIWKVTFNCFKTKRDIDFKLNSLRKANVKEIIPASKAKLNICIRNITS